jgi:IclR family transcriptional regulator, KDG regulon repressor
MGVAFKRVPALDKCVGILSLLAESEKALGISDISNALGYHKSTVFNTVYTLLDLGVLEGNSEGKFRFGARLYSLVRAAAKGSDLVSSIRPYLQEVNEKTGLSAFLGIRSGSRAVIVDKVDSHLDIKVSSETGMRIPLLAGAGGKVLLSQLSDAEIDSIVSENKLKKSTPSSFVNKRGCREIIKKVRQEGFAIDDEEYIEGVRALAVPLRLNRDNLQAAIWVMGLKSQIKDESLPLYKSMLKKIAKKIEDRLWNGD